MRQIEAEFLSRMFDWEKISVRATRPVALVRDGKGSLLGLDGGVNIRCRGLGKQLVFQCKVISRLGHGFL